MGNKLSFKDKLLLRIEIRSCKKELLKVISMKENSFIKLTDYYSIEAVLSSVFRVALDTESSVVFPDVKTRKNFFNNYPFLSSVKSTIIDYINSYEGSKVMFCLPSSCDEITQIKDLAKENKDKKFIVIV